MKRLASIFVLVTLSVFACFGQSVNKVIPVKELIGKRYGTYCVNGKFAGLYDSAKLIFLINDDDYIIPIRLQKKDLGAEKRFLDLNLKEGDFVYVSGVLDDILIGGEQYKGLVDATIMDEDEITAVTAVVEVEEAAPFHLVEVKPRFNGGDANEFSEWVNAHLKYPRTAKENGVQGRVTLQFTIETDGSVSGVKILRGVEPSLDKEAVRVVSSSPKWEPGLIKGEPVRVTYTFPVIFQLR